MSKAFELHITDVMSATPNSAPVFRARETFNDKRKDEINLALHPSFEVKINLEHPSDPVDKIILASMREQFDTYDLKYKWNCSTRDVFTKIVNELITVFKEHSGLKNPKASKVYKWLDNVKSGQMDELRKPSSQTEGLLMLYRYGYKYNFTFTGADSTHAKNIIAILEKMRQKYER